VPQELSAGQVVAAETGNGNKCRARISVCGQAGRYVNYKCIRFSVGVASQRGLDMVDTVLCNMLPHPRDKLRMGSKICIPSMHPNRATMPT